MTRQNVSNTSSFTLALFARRSGLIEYQNFAPAVAELQVVRGLTSSRDTIEEGRGT